jgi:hypothetical protein
MNRKTLDLVLARGIRPNRKRIVQIGVAGDVAVLVFEPSDGGVETAKKLGRRGEELVFAVSNQTAAPAMPDADAITQKWFSSTPSKGVFRIYVLVNDEQLLVNFQPGHGFSLEPGSAEKDVLNRVA